MPDGLPATMLRHEEVARELRQEVLRNYRPGDRLPPDTANAARYGVSVVTLRDAMRVLCREGLLKRRRGSGTYVRERPVVAGRVAIVCSDVRHLSGESAYWRLIVQHVQRRLKTAGFTPELHIEVDGELDVETMLRAGADLPLAGAVLVHVLTPDSDAGKLVESGLPVVACTENLPCAFRASNDTAGMVREAVRYLVERGRRNLALVTKEKPDSSHPGIDDWMEESFVAALAQHNVPFVSDWVCGVSHKAGPGAAFDTMLRLWRARNERPDGLLITDDSIFPEVAMGIMELDVEVPGELIVISHANLGAEPFSPFPVTRFAFDPDRTAAMLVNKFHESLAGKLQPPPFAVMPFTIFEPAPIHPKQGSKPHEE